MQLHTNDTKYLFNSFSYNLLSLSFVAHKLQYLFILEVKITKRKTMALENILKEKMDCLQNGVIKWKDLIWVKGVWQNNWLQLSNTFQMAFGEIQSESVLNFSLKTCCEWLFGWLYVYIMSFHINVYNSPYPIARWKWQLQLYEITLNASLVYYISFHFG